MAFIKWGSEMSVGIEEIDSQHRELISIMNEAAKLAGKKGSVGKKTGLFSRIVAFARYHFDTEERFFKKYKYPFAEEHMVEHEKLTRKVIKLYDDFKEGKDNIKEFLDFLKDWLENHLMTHDMKYAKFFKSIGVNSY